MTQETKGKKTAIIGFSDTDMSSESKMVYLFNTCCYRD